MLGTSCIKLVDASCYIVVLGDSVIDWERGSGFYWLRIFMQIYIFLNKIEEMNLRKDLFHLISDEYAFIEYSILFN